MIRIDKGVPVPPRKAGKGAELKYPWPHLSPGDSFFVQNANRNSIYAGARNWSKKIGYKFTCRSEPGGIRVWRVS